jgi:hypothetical protein
MDIWGWAASTVRGNYIRRIGFTGIGGIQSLMTTSWTTPALVDMTFSRNVLDGTKMSPDWWLHELGGIELTTFAPDVNGNPNLLSVTAHQNIAMVDNFIADPGRAAVWIGNTAGGNVSGNYFLHPNERLELAGAYPPKTNVIAPLIVDTTSTGITTSGNTVDSTSGIIFVTDTQYRELAAYAPGSTVRLNAYNVGTLPNLTITFIDADGVQTAAGILNTTTHAVDIGLPSGAALGGGYITAISNSTKFFGTLFADSQDNIPALNGCIYEVSVPATSVAATAGNFQALVVTQSGCAYQAVDPDPFVTVGGQSTGTGVVTVGFTLNNGAARNTTIEIAGQPINVTQDSALSVVSVTPAAGTGLAQIFAGLYSDTNGVADINTAMLDINTSTSLASGCAIQYVRGSNQLFLMNDAGTTWMGPGIPGDAGTLQNSQCTLGLQASSINSAANNLTVNYALTFNSNFQGLKSIFMNASSNGSLTTGWQPRGTWNVKIKARSGQLTSQ